jgi:hypothetical protein
VKVAIGVLTFNRPELLTRTLASIPRGGHPCTVDILDNGSGPAAAAMATTLGAERNSGPDYTVGHGYNLLAERMLARQPDLMVFSGDDFEYRSGWLADLVDFWQFAPPALALLGTYQEPRFRWNGPYGALEAGPKGTVKQRCLLRFDLGMTGWTFKATDWPLIGPLQETTCQGETKVVTRRLWERRLLVGALDLVTHLGLSSSLVNPEGWARAGDIGPECRAWGV